jgi:two-component system sensor kinase FixL
MNIDQAYRHLPVGIILVKGSNLEIVDANQKFYEKVGLLEGSLTGTLLPELFQDFIVPEINTNAVFTLVSGERFMLIITEVPKEDYKLVVVQAQSFESLLKAEIEDKESRLQAIINTAADGIITMNRMGIVETINFAAAKLFGYNVDEVIGQNIKMLMPEPYHSNHDEYLENYKETGDHKIIGIGREVIAKKKDGTRFPIHLSISESILHDHIIYTGILHDMTAQKNAEEKVRRYAMELERSNSELQDFAYVSSHDLQEPLRKIRAFGDRLKRESARLSERGANYLERMVYAADRMQNLIDDLLSFSRISTHTKTFQLVDLNAVLKDIMVDLDYLVDSTKATVEIGNLPFIEAEPVQMRQLFQNLISNAIKFRKDTIPPIIRIHAVIEPRKSKSDTTVSAENLVTIYVEDNGIGFEEQYKDKIFQIFQRLEGRKYEGSGIGLAICKRITALHGGDIDVETSLNIGTTFIVSLPINQPKMKSD